MSKGGNSVKQFEVALSFAGEQRGYVEQVAQQLHERGVSVFYDRFEQEYLWGRDLAVEFNRVFERSNALVVMFVSADYVKKAWPTHERRSILSRMVKDDQALVLPVRFDDSEVPGLVGTIAWIDANDYSAGGLAAMIVSKLGITRFSGKASDVPAPRATSLAGEITFCYSDYDGRFIIGYGDLEFETMWTKAGDKSIHLYNDPPSIDGVALDPAAQYVFDSNGIGDAQLNYTARVRTVPVGGVAVIRNSHGNYAHVQVVGIESDASGGDRDRLKIQYGIRRA